MNTLRNMQVVIKELEEQYRGAQGKFPVDAFIKPLAEKLLPYFIGRTYLIQENVSGIYTIVFQDRNLVKPDIILYVAKEGRKFMLVTDLEKYVCGTNLPLDSTGFTGTLLKTSDYCTPLSDISIEDIVLHLNNLKSLKKEKQEAGNRIYY